MQHGAWYTPDFQLPLSGSPIGLQAISLVPSIIFQLPLSGSQSCWRRRSRARRSQAFQLPLSGSQECHEWSDPSDHLAFNSLSRDHRRCRREMGGYATQFFQLPLSGSHVIDSFIIRAERDLELSTPSLGITRASLGREPRLRKLSTPSLGITSFQPTCRNSSQYLRSFNSLSRDHRFGDNVSVGE